MSLVEWSLLVNRRKSRLIRIFFTFEKERNLDLRTIQGPRGAILPLFHNQEARQCGGQGWKVAIL